MRTGLRIFIIGTAGGVGRRLAQQLADLNGLILELTGIGAANHHRLIQTSGSHPITSAVSLP